MKELNTDKALINAILELIEKCETIEELRDSIGRIMNNEEEI